MENINIGVIKRKKELKYEIMEYIERDSLIKKFDANIHEVFSNFTNLFTKKKIYFSLVLKYINSKKLNDIIKNIPKLNNKYKKEINITYIYSLFYIYLNFQLFNKDKRKIKTKLTKINIMKKFSRS